jgi:hypothetical protein
MPLKCKDFLNNYIIEDLTNNKNEPELRDATINKMKD